MEKEKSKTPAPLLQVLICTYGREGLERVAAASHPRMKGVEYLVSIQQIPEGERQNVPQSLVRDDFKLVFHLTKGLSVNRNEALSRASAPFLLFSDDDTDYTEHGLGGVISAFMQHPEADILTFRYASSSFRKPYPENRLSLSEPTRGYYVSSIEIAVRRESVQGRIWFNENFGIGATFPSGEEDVFIRDCLDAGLTGMFIPLTICSHDGMTTSERNLMLPSRPQTKGAVFLRLHPRDWPLRMLVHALREFRLWRKGLVPFPISYCREWLRGVRMARKMNVFPTPEPLQYRPTDD